MNLHTPLFASRDLPQSPPGGAKMALPFGVEVLKKESNEVNPVLSNEVLLARPQPFGSDGFDKSVKLEAPFQRRSHTKLDNPVVSLMEDPFSEELRTTFHDVDEAEIRTMLGETAIDVFGFDRQLMEETAARIGPEMSDIQKAP